MRRGLELLWLLFMGLSCLRLFFVALAAWGPFLWLELLYKPLILLITVVVMLAHNKTSRGIDRAAGGYGCVTCFTCRSLP